MIRGKKLVAIIPVRKNSKGIKNKNLFKINGLSILERTIMLSKTITNIDKTLVSTDCEYMYKISKKFNVNTKKKRANKLATKYALTIDVINDVIIRENLKDCYILLLQVTAPLRNLKLTNSFLKKFLKNSKYSTAVSLTEFDHPHPYKVQVINRNKVESLMGKESMVPRQKLKKVYTLNGMFYLAKAEQLLKNKTFFTNSTLPFIVPYKYSINLDNHDDITMLKQRLKDGVNVDDY